MKEQVQWQFLQLILLLFYVRFHENACMYFDQEMDFATSLILILKHLEKILAYCLMKYSV